MKKKNILITLFALILLLSVVAVTYAYYIGSTNNDKAQTANLSTGTMNLIFADNDNGFGGKINFGDTITKKFTIENTGTLDASASIEWNNLKNTYLPGSLIYSLEYSDTLNGTYTKIIEDRNVPVSSVSKNETLIPKITVPKGEKYYYTLTITLKESLTVDQTNDLTASFWTQFNIVGVGGPTAEDTLALLGLTPRTEKPDFKSPSPGMISTDNNFSGNTSTRTVVGSENNYLTYADSYTFNPKSGRFSLVNPKVDTYSNVYDKLAGKYIARLFTLSIYQDMHSENLYETDELSKIFKIVSASSDSYQIIPSSITESFENEDLALYNYDYSETGIYPLEDDYGTSYFYRGNITNNYVKFGKWGKWYKGYFNSSGTGTYSFYSSLEACENASPARYNCTSMEGSDMYFRIIRINGDGSLRMIYDGTEAYANGMSDGTVDQYDRVLGYSTLRYTETGDGYPAKIGYMYGNTEGVTYEEVHKNETSSEIKIFVDDWFKINFVDTGYSKYVSDEIFCNDRSLARGTGIGTTTTFYSAYFRDRYNDPSFICPQKNDKFTVSSKKGNGDLTYPVGLITLDELLAAGLMNSSNNNFWNPDNYLYKNDTAYWTMTPSYTTNSVYMFSMGMNKILSSIGYNQGGLTHVVPVINIGAEFVKDLKGTGTISDPYRFE